MKRHPTLIAYLLLAVLGSLVFPVLPPAEAEGLLVTPAEISFGSVDPSLESLREFKEGLSVFLPQTSDVPESSSILGIFLRQPLTDSTSGRTLSASRIYVGVDTLQALPDSGTLSLSLPGTALTRLRVAVQVSQFDSPGVYEGRLSLSKTPEGNQIVELPIKVELLRWVGIRLAVSQGLLAPGDVIPGPRSYLYDGEKAVVMVSSNSNWRLVAKPRSDFIPQAGPGERPIPATDLRIRVRGTQWVKPVREGFVQFTGEPLALAVGGATGDCGDGWVPVLIEARLPFDRKYAAGLYSSSVEFSAITLGP